MSMIGLGFTVSVGDGSGGSGSAQGIIVDVASITVPEVEIGVVESKRLNLADRVLRKIAGLTEPGQFSFQYEYSTGKKTRLDALIGSDRSFVVTAPDAWTKTVPGFIVSNKLDQVEADGLMMCTTTIQVSGPAS